MKILAFPKDSNPYQELLYTEIRAAGVIVRYPLSITQSASINLFLLIPQIIVWRLCGYNTFHLHWVYAFVPSFWPWNSSAGRKFGYMLHLLLLKSLKFLRYRLVWTAHNVLPHEQVFVDDIEARRILIKLSDLVIVHSQETLEEMRKAIGIVPNKSVVIPHGSYVGIYPEGVTREDARHKFGLQNDDFVYLYLGQIREYKGVDSLIEIFAFLSKENDSKLIIAGKCFESGLKEKIKNLSPSSNIIFHDGYIADIDLQQYFAVADVVVLPFKSVTTSGSALLALSFGKAVIVPRIGDFANLSDSVTYKFSPGEGNELLFKMREVFLNREELAKKNIAARFYAESLQWSVIGHKTLEALKKLFS